MTTAMTLRAAVPRPAGATRALGVDVALAAGGAALVALCAQIEVIVPWTPVPYTLQTFGVLVVGASLGAFTGGLSMLLYLIAGGLGLGVFSGGASGWDQVNGPTGGYLIGFLVSSVVLGAMAERGMVRELRSSITAMLTSLVIVFGFGVTWLAADLGIPAQEALELGLYPFVPGEVVKLYAAGLLLPQAHRLVDRFRADG
jgi:biotin transport system substrate-specific component